MGMWATNIGPPQAMMIPQYFKVDKYIFLKLLYW